MGQENKHINKEIGELVSEMQSLHQKSQEASRVAARKDGGGIGGMVAGEMASRHYHELRRDTWERIVALREKIGYSRQETFIEYKNI